MSTFAADTSVSVEKSRAEIERTLTRYGATAFAYLSTAGKATIMFEAADRRIRFDLPLPAKDDRRFTETPTGRARSVSAALVEWEQAYRQRWRALNLAIKAKLEAVESGIATFEGEFLAYVMLPNGSTVGAWAEVAVAKAYAGGAMPALMAGVS